MRERYTVADALESKEVMLTVQQVADIMRCDPQKVRVTCRKDPMSYGVRACFHGTKILFPRIPFLREIGEL